MFKLEIFNKANMVRNDIIKTYSYAQYVDELNGRGSFEIRIPTNEESLMYLTYGNYIWFEDGVVGIIKGVKDTEDSDVEFTIYGYLTNHILEYRSFLLTSRYYDTIGNIARQMFTDLFINPSDNKRKIPFLSLSQDEEYIPTIPGNVRIQNTGDTLFDVYSEILLPYDLGFELFPIISNYIEGVSSPNLSGMELRLITPVDRTIGNTDGNTPVVFSFDLDNLALLEYEEDGRDYNTVAIVASEGEGQDRRVVEVGDLTKTGIDRIELYVDARDLQSGGGGGGSANLSSISIQTPPTKLEYQVGEQFDSTGLVVYANYDDSTMKNVTNSITSSIQDGYTFQSQDESASKPVTVSYTENGVTKTATYNISVSDTKTVHMKSYYPIVSTSSSSIASKYINDYIYPEEYKNIKIDISIDVKKYSTVSSTISTTFYVYYKLRSASTVAVYDSFSVSATSTTATTITKSYTIDCSETSPINWSEVEYIRFYMTNSVSYLVTYVTINVSGELVSGVTTATYLMNSKLGGGNGAEVGIAAGYADEIDDIDITMKSASSAGLTLNGTQIGSTTEATISTINSSGTSMAIDTVKNVDISGIDWTTWDEEKEVKVVHSSQGSSSSTSTRTDNMQYKFNAA